MCTCERLALDSLVKLNDNKNIKKNNKGLQEDNLVSQRFHFTPTDHPMVSLCNT